MSSTGRKNALPRHENDFYETPAWSVNLILDELGLGPSFEGFVVDPGSGTGAIAECVAKRCPKADVRGVEANCELVAKARALRLPSVGFECADFLTWKPESNADLIIGNPPYQKWTGDVCVDRHLAEKFIRRSLEIAGKKATVALLLRATYMVPKTRRDIRALGCDLCFLERRPSFNGSGCDSTDYAWAVWGPKRGGRWKVLAEKPATGPC